MRCLTNNIGTKRTCKPAYNPTPRANAIARGPASPANWARTPTACKGSLALVATGNAQRIANWRGVLAPIGALSSRSKLLGRGPTGALIYDKGAEASLRCRAAVASTLLAGLELARSGYVTPRCLSAFPSGYQCVRFADPRPALADGLGLPAWASDTVGEVVGMSSRINYSAKFG